MLFIMSEVFDSKEWDHNKFGDIYRKKLSKDAESLSNDELSNNIENNMESVLDPAEKDFKLLGEYFAVPSDIVDEFLSKIKWTWKELLLASNLNDDQLNSLFWSDISTLKKYPMFQWEIKFYIPLYYLKKLCPDNYVEIMDSMIHIIMGFEEMVWDEWNLINAKVKNREESFKHLYRFVEKNWSASASMLDYFVAHDWTYLKKSTYPIVKAMFLNDKDTNVDKQNYCYNYYESLWSAIQFYESFIIEPEWVNLFEYLKSTPTKLSNLWWKIVNEIDLNTDKWINFCFHWILSMVKSRPDISFPVYKHNMSENELNEWKQLWNNIIKEYENVLREYILQDFNISENWDRIEKPIDKTFDKVYCISPKWDPVIVDYYISNDTIQSFTSNPVSDYSYERVGDEKKDKESANIKWKEFIDDLRGYLVNHPNDKILVCISEHWEADWSSRNDWSKDDWLKLANMSPNLKIWSIRCFFWTAFEQEEITNLKSSVSWYSNNSPTWWPVTLVINDAAKLGLWYHEMEIYSRLKYLTSVSPLTESLSYTDWNTWKTEIWKIWLAQNNSSVVNFDEVDIS